jgi:hypothetical protein
MPKKQQPYCFFEILVETKTSTYKWIDNILNTSEVDNKRNREKGGVNIYFSLGAIVLILSFILIQFKIAFFNNW